MAVSAGQVAGAVGQEEINSVRVAGAMQAGSIQRLATGGTVKVGGRMSLLLQRRWGAAWLQRWLSGVVGLEWENWGGGFGQLAR
jgi:hypothetical protein